MLVFVIVLFLEVEDDGDNATKVMPFHYFWWQWWLCCWGWRWCTFGTLRSSRSLVPFVIVCISSVPVNFFVIFIVFMFPLLSPGALFLMMLSFDVDDDSVSHGREAVWWWWCYVLVFTSGQWCAVDDDNCGAVVVFDFTVLSYWISAWDFWLEAFLFGALDHFPSRFFGASLLPCRGQGNTVGCYDDDNGVVL